MAVTILDNARVLDIAKRDVTEGTSIAIENGVIREVSHRVTGLPGATRIDLANRTVMPGLIDAHCHVIANESSYRGLEVPSQTLIAARAGRTLRGMLDRGFTSVRDTGGADWGLKLAVEEGSLTGPRLFISGRPLSQTGGHGDMRYRTETHLLCACAGLFLLANVADGVDGVIRAAREELRQGADQLKIMVSGGVVSPYDPIESVQYSAEEVRAICREAAVWGTYVTAHAYGADAIRHAVANGVRCIEHGNLLDEDAATRLAEARGFMVPTLVAYEALNLHGKTMGLSDIQLDKARGLRDQGLRSIEIAAAAGVPLGFGSDLHGPQHAMQSLELSIRGQVQPSWEVLHSATITNARILRQEGRLGVVAQGAFADLLVVNGDPVKDLNLLQDQGRHLAAIMIAGRFHKLDLN